MRVSTRAPRAEEFQSFAALVEDHDGVEPFGEATRRDILEDRPARYLAIYDDSLVALAIMGKSATQLAVHPDYRGQGIGRELISHVTATVDPLIWANGNSEAAQTLARQTGLEQIRSVVKMEVGVDEIHAIDGPSVELAAMTEADIPEIVELNNAAFADHPEQSGLTADELIKRGGEVLVARDGDKIVGFAWIKTDPAELYVLGVAPEAQGRGLGKVLTAHAVEELGRRGASRVCLFSSGEDERALGLYRSCGFSEVRRDVMYGRSAED